MTREQFGDLIASITARIQGKPLDHRLAAELNETFPPHGIVVKEVIAACREGTTAGWMCGRDAGGIKYGRVIKPTDRTHGFSVDVVEMEDLKGPHHRHPNGEIDLVMPLTLGAKFDGHGAGWVVYGVDSAHHPTVTEGKAWVLYLLPEGAIEFTEK
jgi:hypothetical protein